ncbi:MAG: hypothetical protein JO356_18900 [Acidobacteria bacterium]|nr:hypothetical protein [Acidobacteriota bacterium]
MALVLGAAQAWCARFTMNPDGVSYLDIADAYWQGDWGQALNAYWSPLYSWILGFLLGVFKPSIRHEYPMVHLANYLIFVAALVCFEYFLLTFIPERKQQVRELRISEDSGLEEWQWYLLGYGLFTSSSLILIGLHTVTPDLCVAGVVYLASGLILRIRASHDNATAFLFLGIVLGFGYLSKTVMFPLAVIYIGVAIAAARPSTKVLHNAACVAVAFFAVAGPFVLALSHQKKRWTFGDSGSSSYAHYVNHIGYWSGGSSMVNYPVVRLATSPPIYAFDEPRAGTFPPWYDPVHWDEGITAIPTLQGEAEPIISALALYAICFLILFAGFTGGAFLLWLQSSNWRASILSLAKTWPIFIPALSTLALYSLVYVETRYVAAQLTLLILTLYSGVIVRAHQLGGRLVPLAIPCAIGVVALTSVLAWHYRVAPSGAEYPKAAEALYELGARPDDKMGLIWNENWNAGAGQGAFVPRLLRLKIVVEAPDADAFWKLDASTQHHALEIIRKTGVKLVLARQIPLESQIGWQRLGTTEYFAYLFAKQSSS